MKFFESKWLFCFLNLLSMSKAISDLKSTKIKPRSIAKSDQITKVSAISREEDASSTQYWYFFSMTIRNTSTTFKLNSKELRALFNNHRLISLNEIANIESKLLCKTIPHSNEHKFINEDSRSPFIIGENENDEAICDRSFVQ